MKNKKGFTLVELIAVMGILILIVVFAFPNFAGLTKTSKNKYDNTVCVLLRNAASMYVNNHLSEFTTESKTITIGTLIDEKYLDINIRDSKGTVVSRSDYVTVKRKNVDNNIEYTYECPQVLNSIFF